MIFKLKKLNTQISIIQEIPTVFFREIENSTNFGNHLFPSWAVTVFASTNLFKKFETVYNKYKSIKTKSYRDKILKAFKHNNLIEDLCNNKPGAFIIGLNDLPKRIQQEIEGVFLYLYNKALNHHKFELYVNDTLKNAIHNFRNLNGLEVCPFCAIESFLEIEGQSRLALDHWLCKESFPMAAVNFDNLFPIGEFCNKSPAKGSKNILIDNPQNKARIIAFYPYLNHKGIETSFKFIKEPTINGINDNDWEFHIAPNDVNEGHLFNSWSSIFNISVRYSDYFKKNIFTMWESIYKRFIEKHPTLLVASNIDELRYNLEQWKASFDIKGRPGSLLFLNFIDYLINDASDEYLQSLCENFKRT